MTEIFSWCTTTLGVNKICTRYIKFIPGRAPVPVYKIRLLYFFGGSAVVYSLNILIPPSLSIQLYQVKCISWHLYEVLSKLKYTNVLMFYLIAPPRWKLSSSQFAHRNGGGINFVLGITFSFFSFSSHNKCTKLWKTNTNIKINSLRWRANQAPLSTMNEIFQLGHHNLV